MSELDEIVKVAIHPAIGIARVGNSPTDHFFGPEVPGEAPSDPDSVPRRPGPDQAPGRSLPDLRAQPAR